MEPNKDAWKKCPHCGEEVIDQYLFVGETIDYVTRNLETGGIQIHLKLKCPIPFCEKPIYVTLCPVKFSKEPPEIMR